MNRANEASITLLCHQKQKALVYGSGMAKMSNTYRFAEVACAGVHALLPLTVAAAPTSVDGHTWRFKEGVCCCSKFLPHIYTHLTWHALSLSPLIINTCRVIGSS